MSKDPGAKAPSIDRIEGLRAEGGMMLGTAIVGVPSWANAAARAAALDRLLAAPLAEFATTVQRTLVAAGHRYAFPRAGRDAKGADGGLVYDLRGRFEGESIVPSRAAPTPSSSDAGRE